MTDWEDTLLALLRARQPGVYVSSLEESRVILSIQNVAVELLKSGQRDKFALKVWSPATFEIVEDPVNPKTQRIDNVELFEALKTLRESITVGKDGTKRSNAPGILILCDVWSRLTVEDMALVRMLRETLEDIATTKNTIIMLGRPWNPPEELHPRLKFLPFELPDFEFFEKLFTQIVLGCSGVPLEKTQIAPFARACTGLTELEARELFSLSLAKYGAFDARAVTLALHEKALIVKRSGVLQYKTPQGGLDRVGGLAHLKQYIRDQDSILKNAQAAKAYGLSLPKGILVFGVQGTGKSHMAEMLAAHWQLPLLYFDVGRIFGPLVGETEANLRHMMQLCQTIRPCVLFIDEIEKALLGDSERDGGTSSRIKGALLTWLQEKPDDIFVYATANNVERFMSAPEMIRAGRFDKLFFVDLPNYQSRLDILAIHVKQAGHEVDLIRLEQAARISRGYSGAELQVAVKEALSMGFNAGCATPTATMYTNAVKRMTPLYKTMKEPVERIRQWCKEGRAIPAGETLEDEVPQGQSLPLLGDHK